MSTHHRAFPEMCEGSQRFLPHSPDEEDSISELLKYDADVINSHVCSDHVMESQRRLTSHCKGKRVFHHFKNLISLTVPKTSRFSTQIIGIRNLSSVEFFIDQS